MQLEQFIFNSFQTRCCVVWDADKRCTITDPGCSSEKELEQLTGFIAEKDLMPVCILLTHGHFDHIPKVPTGMFPDVFQPTAEMEHRQQKQSCPIQASSMYVRRVSR